MSASVQIKPFDYEVTHIREHDGEPIRTTGSVYAPHDEAGLDQVEAIYKNGDPNLRLEKIRLKERWPADPDNAIEVTRYINMGVTLTGKDTSEEKEESEPAEEAWEFWHTEGLSFYKDWELPKVGPCTYKAD